MTKAPKKRAPGRPTLPASERKGRNLTFRCRSGMHEKLTDAAQLQERSLSEEIERRLEQSFSNEVQQQRDNRLTDLLARDHVLNVMLAGGEGADFLDRIAFEMLQRPNWESSADTRDQMATIIKHRAAEWSAPIEKTGAKNESK